MKIKLFCKNNVQNVRNVSDVAPFPQSPAQTRLRPGSDLVPLVLQRLKCLTFCHRLVSVVSPFLWCKKVSFPLKVPPVLSFGGFPVKLDSVLPGAIGISFKLVLSWQIWEPRTSILHSKTKSLGQNLDLAQFRPRAARVEKGCFFGTTLELTLYLMKKMTL